LAANPAELKVKIEHDADLAAEPAPIAAAHSAEEKLRAYWTMKGPHRPTARNGCLPSWRKSKRRFSQVKKATNPILIYIPTVTLTTPQEDIPCACINFDSGESPKHSPMKSDVDFDTPGEGLIAIVGENGAGKSR